MRSAPVPLPETLTDGVTTLRLRRVDDVPIILAAAQDPEVRHWLDDEPRPQESPAENVARILERFDSGSAAPLVIADAASDEPMGLINLQFRSDALATIAYSVFPAARGRGVAVRAVRIMERWATGRLGLAELRLEIDRDNLPSLRVAAKLGWHELSTPESAMDERVFTSLP